MSRDKILQNIRKNAPSPVSTIEDQLNETPVFSGKLKGQFAEILKMVGAEVVELDENEDPAVFIGKNCPGALNFSQPEVWDEYPPSCPKEKLAAIDTAVLKGQIGVAENGAIWVDESNFPNRLVPFIAQRLIITIETNRLVANMSDAYRAIELENQGFGVFISGPSKTADIEQSLVYGAHGAKSMTVIICK